MYIITFLFITILWQLALLVTLFLGWGWFMDLREEFSFSWSAIYPTLGNLFWLTLTIFGIFFIITNLVDIFIKLKKESFLSG